MVRTPAVKTEDSGPPHPDSKAQHTHSEGGGCPHSSRARELKPSPGASRHPTLNLASTGEDPGGKEGAQLLCPQQITGI